jgi:hypothetical protein
VYKTNSKGLRDREYPLLKPAGKIRILAIGDSFTFGTGIAYGERYTDRLESAFDDLEVISMAVPGSGHDQQLMQFVHEGIAYHPDHVFVFVTSASLDPMRYFRPLLREGRVELPPSIGSSRAGSRAPKRASRRRPSGCRSGKSHALSLACKLFPEAQLRFRPVEDESGTNSIRLPAGSERAGAAVAGPFPGRARPAVFRRLVEIAAANGIALTFINLESTTSRLYLGGLDAGPASWI